MGLAGVTIRRDGLPSSPGPVWDCIASCGHVGLRGSCLVVLGRRNRLAGPASYRWRSSPGPVSAQPISSAGPTESKAARP